MESYSLPGFLYHGILPITRVSLPRREARSLNDDPDRQIQMSMSLDGTHP